LFREQEYCGSSYSGVCFLARNLSTESAARKSVVIMQNSRVLKKKKRRGFFRRICYH